MSRNGTGTYSLPAGNPVVTNTTVSSTWANNTLNDIATALTASIANDGQTTPIANLPMGGYIHTGVGDATLRTQYPSYGQVQDNKPGWGGTAGGTADALTLGPSVGVTAYATGQRFEFIAASANATTTPTVAVSGLAAKTIVDRAGNALVAGAIQPGICRIEYDGTYFRLDREIGGTTSLPGILKVVDSTSSTSTTDAASPNSVKSAYDLATSAKTSYVYKTSQTQRTSNTTPSADPDLQISLAAGHTYDVEIYAMFQGGAIGAANAQGYKFAVQFSGTVTSPNVGFATWTSSITTFAGQTINLSATPVSVSTVSGSNFTPDAIHIKATVTVSVTGNLMLYWSQNSSSATYTTCWTGSMISARLIA